MSVMTVTAGDRFDDELAQNRDSGSDAVVRGIALDDSLQVSTLGDLRSWASLVSRGLRVGRAGIDRYRAPTSGVPLPSALVVGGWTQNEPCCVGHPALDASDIGIARSADEAGDLWRCGGCGRVVEPTRWATMPLRAEVDRSGTTVWQLPSAGAVSEAANQAWTWWTAALRREGERAAMRLQGVLDELMLALPHQADSYREDLGDPTLLTASPPLVPLGSAGLVWGEARRADRGEVLIGYWAPAPIESAYGPWDRIEAVFRSDCQLGIDPTRAVRILGDRQRKLIGSNPTHSELQVAWAACMGAPVPEWLCAVDADQRSAIGAEIALLAEQRRPSRGLSL